MQEYIHVPHTTHQGLRFLSLAEARPSLAGQEGVTGSDPVLDTASPTLLFWPYPGLADAPRCLGFGTKPCLAHEQTAQAPLGPGKRRLLWVS